jgi:hypothetical protein
MDLKRHLDGLSRELIAVLEKMTEPDPDERLQSADEVRRLLRASAASAGKRGARKRTRKERTRTRKERARDERNRQRALARRAAETLAAPEPDEPLVPIDESVPAPLRMLIYGVLWLVGTAGWLGLTVARAVMLPVLFTVIGAFVSKETRPKLRSVHNKVRDGLDTARTGFRRLGADARGGSRRRRLPSAHSDGSDGRDDGDDDDNASDASGSGASDASGASGDRGDRD